MAHSSTKLSGSPLAQFIVYACPTGALADQLTDYLKKSRNCCGANAAHRYMPHCTLTGFFHDAESSVPLYVEALSHSLADAQETRPSNAMQIKALSFREDWHGIDLASDWLTTLIANFSRRIDSPTRHDSIRLKTWLHLSLAYEFEPSQSIQLEQLARGAVDITSAVAWELRYYQRIKQQEPSVTNLKPVDVHEDGIALDGGDRWICHHSWSI